LWALLIAGVLKSLIRFLDMQKMGDHAQLGGNTFDEFHLIAAVEKVLGGDAFPVFNDIGDFRNAGTYRKCGRGERRPARRSRKPGIRTPTPFGAGYRLLDRLFPD
jgi:hypothetical protein